MTTPPPTDPLDEKYQHISQQAAEFLGRAVDGNGLRADQVALKQHTTEVHRIPGALTVELKHQLAESVQKGQVAHGQVLGSKQAMLGTVEGLQPELLKSESLQKRILAHVEKIPGQGWGMTYTKMLLPETHKEFSVIDKCLKCNGLAKNNCITCNAIGMIPCQDCYGQGLVPCLTCHNTGRIAQNDGSQTFCLKCNGQGRMFCPRCQNTRTMPCPTCNRVGFIGCIECNQSGYWTHVYSANYEAHIHFVPDRTANPPPVQEIIDKLHIEELGTKGHADIIHAVPVLQEKGISIPLTAVLPLAAAEFIIGDKTYPATVAGLNAHIVEIEPFMDALVKPGINALYQLTKSTGTDKNLIDTVYQYRILREILSELAQHPARVVYQKVTHEYPVILSEKYANISVKHANAELLKLGRKNRIKGLMTGTLLTFVLLFLYHLSPLRTVIMQILAQKNMAQYIVLADATAWGIGYLMTLYMVKAMVAKALRRFLPGIVTTLPAAGMYGIYALGTTLLAFLAAQMLFKKLGL